MKRLLLTPENSQSVLQEALACLSEGGLVIYPTETVYGAGVDATSTQGVTKVLIFKNRPAGKAISVLFGTVEQAQKAVTFNQTAQNLAHTFLPGPLTLICESLHTVDPRLEAEVGTLGVRISSHPFTNQLATTFAKGITATSANASGKARPYTVDGLLKDLSPTQLAQIDLIIDAGTLPHREPSTVVDTTQGTQEIVRSGENIAHIYSTFISTNEAETAQIAKDLLLPSLSALRDEPIVFLLEGDLGAGKTHFAKGLAEVLQITQVVASPTYTISKEYTGEAEGVPTRFAHLDCWRIENPTPQDLGLENLLTPHTVLAVEWPGSLVNYFKKVPCFLFHLSLGVEEDGSRTIHLLENAPTSH